MPDFGSIFIYLPSSIIFTCFPGGNHYSNLHSYLSVFIFYSHMALVVKNPSVNEGDIREAGLIPGLGRSPGGMHGKALQYPCLENPHGQRKLSTTVHRVTKSWKRLKQLTTMNTLLHNMPMSNLWYLCVF